MLEVNGIIVRRRSMGKHLAFADIQRDDDASMILKTVFRRASSSWDKSRDDTFPTKNSQLPYGAQVRVQCVENRAESINNETQVANTQSSSSLYEVCTWEMLVSPKAVAQEAAKQQEDNKDAIDCSTYLESRAKEYFTLHPQQQQQRASRKHESSSVTCRSALPLNGTSIPTSSCHNDNSHGDKRFKGLRAKIFAEWLVETFGVDSLQQGSGILDVAGGKGQLAMELAARGKIPCTVIDPLIRKRQRKSLKRLAKLQAPAPTFLARPFDANEFLQQHDELIQTCSCLVGLHPDECTQDILKVALRYNKPVAIIPCCVFPNLFPGRQMRNGRPVCTYEEFLQYLMEQDKRLKRTTLPFEGRNQVIYMVASDRSND